MLRQIAVMLFASATFLLSAGSYGQAEAQSPSSKSFAGPFVGVAAVYGWAESDVRLSRPGFADITGTAPAKGPAVAGFAGYDWHVGNGTVVGLVGDLGAAKLGGSGVRVAPVVMARGRLGQTLSPNTLLYGTAGWNFVRQSQFGTLGGAAYDVTQWKNGVVYGGGVESRVQFAGQPMRLGLEVLRSQLGTFEFDAGTRHVAITSKVWTVGLRAAFELQSGR